MHHFVFGAFSMNAIKLLCNPVIRTMSAMSDQSIAVALKQVNDRIAVAAQNRSQEVSAGACNSVRLVAVSKTKPVECIVEAYACGQRHFGENYINELYEKANDSQIREKCADIKWHFIGRIQSKAINRLLSVPNLYLIETIHSEKVAETLNKSLQRMCDSKNDAQQRLKIMVQINTSGEQNKNGIEPNEAVSLVSFIIRNCPHLQFIGIMTIGAINNDASKCPNPDFQCLVECKRQIMSSLNITEDIELSMGMSSDFEHAITVGSTNVRVGSTIFGARQYKHLQK